MNFRKIFLIPIFLALVFSCEVFAQETNNFKGVSITDFKMFKVTPQKSLGQPSLTENSSGQKKEVKDNSARIQAVKDNKTIKPAKLKANSVTSSKEKTSIKKADKKISKSMTSGSNQLKNNPKKIVEKKSIKESVKKVQKLTQPEEKKPRTPIKTDDSKINQDSLAKDELENKNLIKSLNSYLENETENIQTDIKSGEMTSYDYFIKPMLSLLIVLFMIIIFALAYGRLKGINTGSIFSGKSDIKDLNKFNVLSSSALGQGKVIHLVEINGKQLVVGSTNNNINLLTEINPEDIEKLQEKAKVNAANDDLNSQELQADNLEYFEPDNYEAGYSEVYKDYIKDRDKED